MLPLTPNNTFLPFDSPGFHWTDFEAFFCDFFSLGITLPAADGTEVKVVEVRHYNVPGTDQEGIDLVCKMANGESWVVQCKHNRKTKWTEAATKKVCEKCTYNADRYFLLVSELEVGEAARKPIRRRKKWKFWDGRQISTEFIRCFKDRKQDGAAILYRNFGSAWAEQFFDVRGRSPFQTSGAYFGNQLKPEAGRAFDLLGPMQGRQKELEALRSFATSKNKQVCLLSAPGFWGKSRLLLEFARTSSKDNMTILFVAEGEPSQEQLNTYLDLVKGTVIVVLDQAHSREEEINKLLGSVLPSRDAKIIMAVRPGPLLGPIKTRIRQAGVDSRALLTLPLKRLTHKDARALAEQGLEPHFPGCVAAVSRLARKNPGFAVLTAKLIREGKLYDKLIEDTDEFKHFIMVQGFDSEKESLEKAFANAPVLKALHLIALLGPLENNLESRSSLAAFLEQQPEDVSGMIDAFVETGIVSQRILTDPWTGMKTLSLEIEPAILADHLACEACLTKAGQSTGFSERVLQHFNQKIYLPKILRNLSAVDWRSEQNEHETSSEIFDPLWEELQGQFEHASNDGRAELLDHVAPIVTLQPRRVLQLIRWMVKQGAAPEVDIKEEWWTLPPEKKHEWNLRKAIGLLETIGNQCPSEVGSCLDLLWQFEKRGFKSGSWGNSPIRLMSNIASYQIWKSPKIQDAFLDWVESCSVDSTSLSDTNLTWFLPELLRPIFNPFATETWLSEPMVATSRAHLIPFRMWNPLRKRVFDFCEKRLGWDRRWQLGIISVLSVALEPARAPHPISSLPKAFRERHDEGRLHAMQLLKKLLENTDDPVIQNQALWEASRRQRYEKNKELLKEASALVSNAAESLPLDLVRILTGRGNAWFEKELTESERDLKLVDQEEVLSRKCQEFADKVGLDFVEAHPSPQKGLELIENYMLDLEQCGFHPKARELLFAFSRVNPAYAKQLAQEILEHEVGLCAQAFGILALHAFENKKDIRSVIEKALASNNPVLQESVIEFMNWFRKKNGQGFKADAEEVMRGILSSPQLASKHAESMVTHWLPYGTLDAFEVSLLYDLPELSRRTCADKLIRVIAYNLPKGSELDEDSLAKMLLKTVAVESYSDKSTYLLGELGKRFPLALFRLLEARVRHAKKLPEGNPYFPLPSELRYIDFSDFIEIDDVCKKAVTFLDTRIQKDRVDSNEAELYHHILCQGTESHFEIFKAALSGISSAKELDRLIDFLQVDLGLDISSKMPLLIKELLQTAQDLGAEVFEEIQKSLLCKSEITSSTNGIPDRAWQASIDHTRSLANRYADDPLLGPFYKRLAKTDAAEIQDREKYNQRRNQNFHAE